MILWNVFFVFFIVFLGKKVVIYSFDVLIYFWLGMLLFFFMEGGKYIM